MDQQNVHDHRCLYILWKTLTTNFIHYFTGSHVDDLPILNICYCQNSSLSSITNGWSIVKTFHINYKPLKGTHCTYWRSGRIEISIVFSYDWAKEINGDHLKALCVWLGIKTGFVTRNDRKLSCMGLLLNKEFILRLNLQNILTSNTWHLNYIYVC